MGIDRILDGFLGYLGTTRLETLAAIAKLENGFEDWLKFELAAWLITAHNYQPKANTHGVGVEYRARLDLPPGTPWRDCTQSKRIDLWVTSGSNDSRDSDACYFELKVAFDNSNWTKQLGSWVSDYRALDALHCDEWGSDWASLLFVPASSTTTMSRRVRGFVEHACADLAPYPARRVSEGTPLERVLAVFVLSGGKSVSE